MTNKNTQPCESTVTACIAFVTRFLVSTHVQITVLVFFYTKVAITLESTEEDLNKKVFDKHTSFALLTSDSNSSDLCCHWQSTTSWLKHPLRCLIDHGDNWLLDRDIYDQYDSPANQFNINNVNIVDAGERQAQDII